MVVVIAATQTRYAFQLTKHIFGSSSLQPPVLQPGKQDHVDPSFVTFVIWDSKAALDL